MTRIHARLCGRFVWAATMLGVLSVAPAGALPPDQPAESGAADRPPSLLLVTLDTTRWDHLQPYGADVETPVLAALAADGVVFEQAYAVAPITLPADNGRSEER